MPSRAPKGWVQAAVAEQRPMQGGIGIPNFRTELIAMSASTVGEWALAEKKLVQVVGEILQAKDTQKDIHITPAMTAPKQSVRNDIWQTGRPWVERLFAQPTECLTKESNGARKLRKKLRHSDGLRTRWQIEGLHCEFRELATGEMTKMTKVLRKQAGEFIPHAIGRIPLDTIELWNAQGERNEWRDFKALTAGAKHKHVKDLLEVRYVRKGEIIFTPMEHSMPMRSGVAHLYREFCLALLAAYPEIAFPRAGEVIIKVKHPLEDKNHVFEIQHDSDGVGVQHTWRSATRKVRWTADRSTLRQAVANLLDVDAKHVVITPHPALTRMMPLWAGNRRWSQTRKAYKDLIDRERVKTAHTAGDRITSTWARQHPGIAHALRQLTWKRVHRMEGITAYQTQNIVKLKLHKMRLWADRDIGFQCAREGCACSGKGGAEHLIWTCPDAQIFWSMMLTAWAKARSKTKAKLSLVTR